MPQEFIIAAMFSVNNLKKQIGDRILFKELNFTINRGDKVGLVGPNGVGKTTLLKIMAGIATPDAGDFIRPRHSMIGYLAQELSLTVQRRSLWEEVETAFNDLKSVKARLERVSERLSGMKPGDQTAYSRLVEEYQCLFDMAERLGGYEIEARISMVLSGLGFVPTDYSRPLSEFSGGWLMRVELAKILLAGPDILLLDEPTNHLDIDSIRWLENWLREQDVALLMVSHDKAFLDGLCNRIFELSGGRLHKYKGNYSAYLETREKMVRQQESSIRNRQKRVQELERFVERFRAKATKARQVQSRLKMLEKMDIGNEPLVQDMVAPCFRFPEPAKGGKNVVVGEGISKSYGGCVVLQDVNFRVMRGERIAVVGSNGSGKSTLVRIIAGTEDDFDGRLVRGHGVSMAYFAQNQAVELDQSMTLLETLLQASHGAQPQLIRDILGAFMFTGDEVNKKVGCLSGGEKSRLALARILIRPANFLILDEPTNHLDIISRQVLKRALSGFSGSFLVVSHDRAFLKGLVNKVWEISSGRFCEYPGGIEDYLERHSPHPVVERSCRRVRPSRHKARERRRQAALRRQELKEKTRHIEKKIHRLEARIEAMEREKTELEALLGDPGLYRNETRARQINLRYREIVSSLEGLYEDWETNQIELDRVR